MNEVSLPQVLTEMQENEVVCVMCEGSHGNNSNCQRMD
jgi:hypothetical protein